MLVPSIFGENLFEDWMDFPFNDSFWGNRNPLYGKHQKNLMKTDVRETAESYELDIDLPGFKKEDLTLQLKDGYLTVNASKQENNDVKDDNGKYLRRERYSGSMSRSFYVGEDTQETDIKAKFENGVLSLAFPKEQPKKIEEPKYIAIEG